MSRQERRSLPSKYREGAELREGAEPIRAVREKALGASWSHGHAVSDLQRGGGLLQCCCSPCLELRKAVDSSLGHSLDREGLESAVYFSGPQLGWLLAVREGYWAFREVVV